MGEKKILIVPKASHKDLKAPEGVALKVVIEPVFDIVKSVVN